MADLSTEAALEAKDRELAVATTALQERLKQVRGILQELEQAEQREAGARRLLERAQLFLGEGIFNSAVIDEVKRDIYHFLESKP